MKKIILICAALGMFATAASAQSFDAKWDKVKDASSLRDLVLHGAVTPQWNQDGTFGYTVREENGMQSYIVNPATKTKTAVESLQPAERRPYNWRGDAQAAVSPDGDWEAYILDNNVWIAPYEGSQSEAPSAAPRGPQAQTRRPGAIQLSFDGTTQFPYNAVIWSPDSKKIAATKFEVVQERQIPLIASSPEDQIQPKLRWLDYAKPGDRLPQEEVALFDAVAKKQIAVDNRPFSNQFNLRFGQWSPKSDYFTFEYNQRGHQLYQLVAVDAATGKTRIAAEEKTNTFVYYNECYRYYFEDGKRALWASERDDWRHLYMVDLYTGAISQIDKGEWNIRTVYYVNEKEGYLLADANGLHAINEKGGKPQGEDPYNKHLIRLDFNGKVTDLTPENANHTISLSPDRKYFVDSYSRPDLPPTSVLRAQDGTIVMELEKADISRLLATGYTMPEVFVAKGRDGKTDIWGTIFRPANFKAKGKYPVIEYIYAGPHDNHVVKDFEAYTRNSFLQGLGFVVVTIDGMGTDNRSKSFQDVAFRNLKDAGFPDRILWMQAAQKQYKYLDLDKVGIYGYSAGGQNTLSALLFHPEFYKVGVSMCGCHDNRMDKIWWNEQWMGYPIGPWYDESSNVVNAHLLQGDLLIMNGELDDNVDPTSTLQVVNALFNANKDFSQFYLPSHTHNMGDMWVTRQAFKYFYEKIMVK